MRPWENKPGTAQEKSEGWFVHIARCLRSLGREAESRRILDYALDLDPDNLEAALEKRRLENRGIL
ncbi:MAG: hypothetical protein LBP60_09780 [Spirochaetaceae bacterium]|jgi:hypothetical protein|nr:hypothetical protein [Spirochaetaceae bacterium]